MINVLYLVGSLVAIILAANWLVDGASAIAKRFNVSDMVIGLTIVAFGTSAPELSVSLTAAVQGNTGIAIGNVLGSNIGNILLILGMSALIYPLNIQLNTKWKEIPLSLLAAIVLAVCANDIFFNGDSTNLLSRSEGIVFLCFFIIFLIYTFGIARKSNGNGSSNPDSAPVKLMPVWKALLFIVIGLIGLFLGGKYLVIGAVNIAHFWGISDSVIGLTIVAIGTSLPELATSLVAAYKKKSDIAVGNIVGSNIFNIFLILGVSATVSPLTFSAASNIDIAVTIGASLALFLSTVTFKRAKIDRIEGGIFILLYIAYLVYLIINA